jgi:hypothetical protein
MTEILIQSLSDISLELFDIYAVNGGIYWKISIKQNGNLKIQNNGPGDIIYNRYVTRGEIIYINYRNERRIKILEIIFNEKEFYINGFFLYSKSEENGIPGFILCGCFDGMTLRHQVLLKIAASTIKNRGYGYIYVDEGEVGDIKHHSTSGFMNSYNSRTKIVSSVLSYFYMNNFKSARKNYTNIKILPRNKKWETLIKEAAEKLIKKGVTKIYYICGLDQVENFKRKHNTIKFPLNYISKNNTLYFMAIDRSPLGDIKSKSLFEFDRLYKLTNIYSLETSIDFKSLKSTYNLSTSSTQIREIRKYKKNIDSNIIHNMDKFKILSHLTSVVFEKKLDCTIKNHQSQKPYPFDLTTLKEKNRIIIYLPGRTSNKDSDISYDSSSLIMARIKEQKNDNNSTFLIVNYKDTKTETKQVIDKIYSNEFKYFNEDAFLIATELFGPFIFKSHFYYDGNKFHGIRYDINQIKENFRKITIITRSIGSIIGHMVSYCILLMIGSNIDKNIIREIHQFDFGPVFGLDKRITYFKHFKIINTSDSHSIDRINYKEIPSEFIDNVSTLYKIDPIDDPYIVLPDESIYYLRDKCTEKQKDKGYYSHSCFCYLGYSKCDKSNKEIRNIVNQLNMSILR